MDTSGVYKFLSAWRHGHGAVRQASELASVMFLVRARISWVVALLLVTLSLVGCAGRHPVASSVPSTSSPLPAPPPVQPPPKSSSTQPPARGAPFVPGNYIEQGVASWYGVPFHGRRAADGEIFDMNTLVAAHRTLPFGSILRVTNLNNGRQIEVRVIDRGPFIEGRILDLARAAAAGLDMIGTGTAPVRIELLSGPSPAIGDFTVQVGAFVDRTNAERLRDRLLARYQPIFIQDFDAPNGHFYRVRVGRVPNPDAAQQLASQLRNSDGFQTFVMRLDQTIDLRVK
jgi:rare lipoprotein A